MSTLNRPHSITADVEIPEGGAEGVLLSHGGNDGGFSFYMQGGKLHYAYNYVADTHYHFESKETVPEGRHKLRYEFEPTGKPDVAKGLGAPGTCAALHRRQAGGPDGVCPRRSRSAWVSVAVSRPAPIPVRR